MARIKIKVILNSVNLNFTSKYLTKMSLQETILIIIAAFALFYLVYYFVQQSKAHNCDDCSLMKLKKENENKN